MAKEELDPADPNEYPMHSVVRFRLDVHNRCGGDYAGDEDKYSFDEQFVWTSAKAELGWCMGVNITHTLAKFFDDPKELEEFKQAVISCVEEQLDETRDSLDAIEDKNKGDKDA